MPEISRNRQNARYAEDVVSVKDFGAKGDGVTDDTAAIQAAIDSVIAGGGGEIFFPAGIYITSSGLTCNPAGYGGRMVTLRGQYSESVIRPTLSSGYALTCRSISGAHSWVKLEGLYLDGQNCTGTASGLMLHKNHNASVFRDLFIENFPQYGIHISENWTISFHNIEVRGSNTAVKGFAESSYGDVSTGQINNISFYGCSFANSNYCVDLGDVNYKTTFPGVGSVPFQTWGFYNCNISGIDRGVRSYYSIGLAFYSSYFEAASSHTPASFVNIELIGCTTTLVQNPFLSTGRNYIKTTDSTSTVMDGFTALSALDASETMFEVTDSELTLKNGYVGSGSTGTFLKYTQTGTKNVKILLENMNVTNTFATKVNETINSFLNTRIGILHSKNITTSDFNASISRKWEVSENGDIRSGSRDALLSDASTGAGTTANGTVAVRINGTTYYLLTSASA